MPVLLIQHNLTGLVNTEKLTWPRQLSDSKPNGLKSVIWASPANIALASDPGVSGRRVLRVVVFSQLTRKDLLLSR